MNSRYLAVILLFLLLAVSACSTNGSSTEVPILEEQAPEVESSDQAVVAGQEPEGETPPSSVDEESDLPHTVQAHEHTGNVLYHAPAKHE